MNPELRRNLWLELSASRMALMAGVLGLIFAIAWLSAPEDGKRYQTLAAVGETLFGLIVGLWGSFKAGRSVSDEIREKTWDFQRLSALSPASMMLGKLFGATAYVWFGGVIVLGAVAYGVAETQGWIDAGIRVGELVLLGMLAHAAALATSLAVVRRGRGKDRVDSFLFTIAGVVAFQTAGEFSQRSGTLFYNVPEAVRRDALPYNVDWFGLHFSGAGWSFFSLGALVIWALIICWRLMRVELQAPANPVWFAGFLIVPTLLLVGRTDTLAEGATVAYFLIHGLVLLTLLLEPKDFVSWRSLVSELGKPARGIGRFWPATLTGLIIAFAAAIAVALASLSKVEAGVTHVDGLLGFAAFAFLLRETAIFAFFHLGARQRRGDFAALVTIGLLCVAGPMILGVLKLEPLRSAFFVNPEGDAGAHLLSIAAGLVEAAIFGVAAQGRWRARETRLAAA